MKVKKIIVGALILAAASAAVAGTSLIAGCHKDEYQENLRLHLAFDEGSGNMAKDSSHNLEDAKIEYVFNEAKYKPSEDPQWRSAGVVNGSLLFDGFSQYVAYDYEQYKVSGDSLTISAYVAPRVFEYDPPKAKEDGTENLTAIVSQFYKNTSQGYMGFVLGYWRYGELSFQVGTGDEWLRVWSGENKLKKYEWNHVVAQFDGAAGKLRLYLNGELAGETDFEAGTQIERAVDTDLLIGRSSQPTTNDYGCDERMVSGLLDEVKIYDAVLDEAYIKDYFNANPMPEIDYEDIRLQNVLTDDIYKTQFHGGPYQNWMNEPHAPIYYNGVYHIFFQHNLMGPYFKQLCWGHLTSDDMVNWTPQPEVVTPTEGSVCPDGVWSGGSTYDVNGIPVIFFTAGNDSFRESDDGLISNQNCGYAYPADPNDPYLRDWIVGEELAIKQQPGQGRTGEFRDMHIFQEDGIWYMTICSGSTTSAGGTALLFTTDNLRVNYNTGEVQMDWKYRGELYTMENQPQMYGKTWELPVLLPIENESGTISKYILAISPAPAREADNNIYYFIGQFNKSTFKFTPDPGFETPHRLDYGNNVFTGPSAFINPVDGEIYMFSVMQDYQGRGMWPQSGWANCVGLARHLWLNDDGTDVKIEATGNLDNYATERVSGNNLTIDQANAKLAGVDEDMVKIDVTFKNISASTFGIIVKSGNKGSDSTRFTYDVAASTITGATQNKATDAQTPTSSGALSLGQDSTLTMEIFIDRSLVEAFFNSSKALSIRSYAQFESTGISLFADGGQVEIVNISVSAMRSIYI